MEPPEIVPWSPIPPSQSWCRSLSLWPWNSQINIKTKAFKNQWNLSWRSWVFGPLLLHPKQDVDLSAFYLISGLASSGIAKGVVHQEAAGRVAPSVEGSDRPRAHHLRLQEVQDERVVTGESEGHGRILHTHPPPSVALLGSRGDPKGGWKVTFINLIV